MEKPGFIEHTSTFIGDAVRISVPVPAPTDKGVVLDPCQATTWRRVKIKICSPGLYCLRSGAKGEDAKINIRASTQAEETVRAQKNLG